MNLSPRIKWAIRQLEEKTHTDTILDFYDSGDFVEFVVRQGGDTNTFRVYNDGRVFER